MSDPWRRVGGVGRGRRRRGEVKAGSDMGSGVSFGGFEREGELGSGLALPQDDFLLLFLLPLTVLLKLHTLLVNLSLLLHNSQLLLSLRQVKKKTKTISTYFAV